MSVHTPDPAASPLAGLSADAAAETERMVPAAIIDVIFQSKGLRIAYGHKGENVSQVSDHIIIEIPDTGISPKWEKTLSRIIKNKMRRLKIPRKELGKATQEQINKMREILNIRFKHNPD